jgi:CDP-glucose 4,6-dehydratase
LAHQVSDPSSASIWHDRPVYVTGGTGLLGGWLVRELRARGADVVCLVRDWRPKSSLLQTGELEGVTVVSGRIEDQPLQERLLNEYEITTVFHLAAQTIVGTANRNPVSTFESNIAGTWSLLEACRRCPTIGQIVVASSDKAYGANPELPYTESTPLCGTHPYDVSKSCADLIAQTYACTYELPVAVTRCGNLFGGGDLNWNRLVPGTIRSVVRGERPVIRSNGKFTRDYLYIEDVVEAYLLLAEHLSRAPELGGQAFNFSYGDPVDVIQMATRVMSAMDVDLELDIRSEASAEIEHQYLDASKAARVLAWEPRYSVDEGLRRTIAWYRRFFESDQDRTPARIRSAFSPAQ